MTREQAMKMIAAERSETLHQIRQYLEERFEEQWSIAAEHMSLESFNRSVSRCSAYLDALNTLDGVT